LLPLTGHILVPFKVRARPNKGILLQLLTFLKAWVTWEAEAGGLLSSTAYTVQ
ncbi:hypothetical protein T09_12350, partial [Trichinella sp. T9]